MLKWHDVSDLVWLYIKKRISAQIKAVSFIVVYLAVFQTMVLNLPITDLPQISIGIFLVILGLTFFMEGLVLGIMPIGEGLGLKLPQQLALPWILLFGLILGLGATFAEPAIGILRAMGSSVNAKEAPLLHFILSNKPQELILSVGAGVGIAVILGMLRFLYNWSLKPLIYPLVILCLGLSSYAIFNTNFSHILGLAWDCGAVTTGPVTVPLVLALGLGISRVVTGHTDEGTSSGFGVVTLASLLPIITVLCLGLYYEINQSYLVNSVANFRSTSSDITQAILTSQDQLLHNFKIAAQAILPLCLFMFFVFRLILRSKFVFLDEIILGVVLSLFGLTLFNFGIEMGLAKLGGQVGRVLPAAYSSIRLTDETKILENFNPNSVQVRFKEDGPQERFFYLQKDKVQKTVLFDEINFDQTNFTYRYTPQYGPIWGEHDFNLTGIIVVLAFAFLMGYGATLAEPALNALGATVETISVGTFQKNLLIQTVAIGVGVGIMIGLSKIIWNIPLIWLLVPPYLLLIFLSHISSEEFVNIGWDSAGVTTGPITVPLVLAMGLGIGNQSGAIEGFGILAMASVCPIMSVLIMGLIVRRNREKIMLEDDFLEEEE